VAAAAASCVVGQDGWESLQYIHETKGGRPAWPRHPFSPAVRLSTETVQIVQILEVFKKKLLLLENQSAVPQSVPPAAPAPAPPPRLEDLPPPRCLPRICSPPRPRAGTRHGRRPGRGGGGRTKSAAAPPHSLPATELEEGAANAVAGRRGHQIRLPPPRAKLEAAGSGQPRRLPAAQAPASATAMGGH